MKARDNLREYYCPFCGNEIVVAHIGTDFDTCECDKCGKIMIERG